MRPISMTLGDMEINVSEVAAGDSGRWDEFVASRPEACLYHRYAWKAIIEEVFGRETYYLWASGGGEVQGILPMVRLKSPVFGDFLVSLPYLTYGGVIAADEGVANALIEQAVKLGQQLGVDHIELRHTTDRFDLPSRRDKVSMHLALPDCSETLWKQLGAKRRSQIKRPIREGATCRTGGAELIDEFYEIFARKYRDLGVPVYSRQWFLKVLQCFEGDARVFIARIGDEPAAASIVLRTTPDRLEVPWAASVRSADRYGINMYLYWQMIEYAANSGFRVFDFGRSTVDSGTWRFKKQWGAEPVQLIWNYWLRRGDDLPVMNASNPKFELAVKLWRRMPLWVANRVGPHIVKNLP